MSIKHKKSPYENQNGTKIMNVYRETLDTNFPDWVDPKHHCYKIVVMVSSSDVYTTCPTTEYQALVEQNISLTEILGVQAIFCPIAKDQNMHQTN